MNEKLLQILKESFISYLNSGSRSNKKLKILHGFISDTLKEKISNNSKEKNKNFEFFSLSKTEKSSHEEKIEGRYYTKTVDITLKNKNNIEDIVGLSIKFMMQNINQNMNNYFENLLGETANLRSNNIPYFHLCFIINNCPYFNKNGKIIKWENLKEESLEKYLKLSKDNKKIFFHSPEYILLCVINIENIDLLKKEKDLNKRKYINWLLSNTNKWDIKFNNLKINKNNYKNISINNFERFIDKFCLFIDFKFN